MPKFYFHTEDGSFDRDADGTDLPDEAAARVEAVRLAGEILKDRPQLAWESQRWRILVTPEAGPALFGIEVLPVEGHDLTPWRHQ